MAKPVKTGYYRGSEGRDKSDDELAKSKARAEARKESGLQPFRFRVAPGETTQFVVLDDEPDFFRYEHNMKDPATGFYSVFTGCVNEWDNCPICAALGKEPYYAMYLTVIDFTPFSTKDGTQHEFSRKLLVVKPAQQKKFYRQFAKAEKDGRTLRGALFDVVRDTDKDSAIGNDIEFVEYLEEDDLASYVRSWKDKEGKKQTEDCSEAYDYEKLFEPPDTEKLRAIVGGKPQPGSRAYEDRELGTRRRPTGRKVKDADDDDPDDGNWQKPERTERMGARPVAGTRRARPSAEHDDDDKPARTSSRRAAQKEIEDDDIPFDRGASRRASSRDAYDDAPSRPAPRRPLRNR